MQPAGGHEHDLIARRKLARRGSASDPRARTPTAAPASSMSRSSSSPGSDGDSPPPHAQPASAHARRQPSSSAVGARGLRVPLRGARGEVGVDHERQRAHAAEVVEDRRDGVVGDSAKRLTPCSSSTCRRDDRLRAESLDHERERPPAELEHERRLSPRSVERAAARRREQRRGRQRLGHRQALGRVERVVVHARRAVAGTIPAHRR